MKANERLENLKRAVESGCMPVVLNCSSGPSDVFTLGDLEDLGWMTKRYTTDYSGEVDGWERDYFGPKPFTLQTWGALGNTVIKPGDTID